MSSVCAQFLQQFLDTKALLVRQMCQLHPKHDKLPDKILFVVNFGILHALLQRNFYFLNFCGIDRQARPKACQDLKSGRYESPQNRP